MRHLRHRPRVLVLNSPGIEAAATLHAIGRADVGTTRAFSGHAQADTLTKHYITPESAAVREATNRAEKALLGTITQEKPM